MPRPIIRTNRRTRKKYPLGSQGHFEQVQERRAERSIDVQMNRGIQQLKREKMGLLPDQPMYEINSHVRTRGGTSGTIIGSAQYVTGWEYRILPDDQKSKSENQRTIYREEWEIAGLNPGASSIGAGSSGYSSRDYGPIFSTPKESERLGHGYGSGKRII